VVVKKEYIKKNANSGYGGAVKPIYEFIKIGNQKLIACKNFRINNNDFVCLKISYLPLSYAAMGADHLLD
jgi:hypothetical protein